MKTSTFVATRHHQRASIFESINYSVTATNLFTGIELRSTVNWESVMSIQQSYALSEAAIILSVEASLANTARLDRLHVVD